MTYPGLGGQQPPPQNSAPSGQLTPGVTPGVSGQVVASRVIIIGTGGELLVYSPAAGAGNLIVSIAAMPGTDPYGNAYLEGITAYVTIGGDRIAVELGQGSFAGSPTAALFTHDQTSPAFFDPMVGAVQASAAGCSMVLYSGQSTGGASVSGVQASDSVFSGVAGGQLEFIGGQVVVQGTLTIDGDLILTTINGSANTGTSGLTSGVINGTSGAASAGTAHTHGPGTFAVANGQHNHTI